MSLEIKVSQEAKYLLVEVSGTYDMREAIDRFSPCNLNLPFDWYRQGTHRLSGDGR